jgi:hypothetical protein
MHPKRYFSDWRAVGLEGSTDVLKSREFFMVLSSIGLAFRRCELVWINGSTAGVHFISNTGKKKKAAPVS